MVGREGPRGSVWWWGERGLGEEYGGGERGAKGKSMVVGREGPRGRVRWWGEINWTQQHATPC